MQSLAASSANVNGNLVQMSDGLETLVSAEFREMISIQYRPEAQAEVCAALLMYGESLWQSLIDRVLFDVLYLAEGDCARLRQLIDAAKQDPRDVINREYFWRAGHIYPHTWARRHAVNRDMPEAPPPDPAVIAVALFQVGSKGKAGDPEGATSFLGTGRPRSLFLSFTDGEKLSDLADRMLTLTDDQEMLDLSPTLEYRRHRNAPRTLVRWLPGQEAETLTYEGGILSWNGNSDYWRVCSRRLSELATSEIAAHLSMMRDSADQRVLIGYRPPGAGPQDHRRWY
jgi:hypothetical protein